MSCNGIITIAVTTEPDGNAPAGYAFIWVDAGIFYTKDDQGVVRTSIAPNFGTNVHDDKTNTVMTNTTASWMTHLSISETVPAGRYRVAMGHACNLSAVNRNYDARLAVNGTEIDALSEELKDSGADIRNKKNLWGYYEHSGGVLLVQAQFKPNSAGDTATAYSSTLELWRTA